ncbi:MAG: hypothetical protein WCF65_08600 [Parachlamydiaceae bacterium]
MGHVEHTVIAPDTIGDILKNGNIPFQQAKSTLVIVDAQGDFINPKTKTSVGGALVVNGADQRVQAIVDGINRITQAQKAGSPIVDQIILTVDNHTSDSNTFFDAKRDEVPFKQYKVSYENPDNKAQHKEYTETKWPPHCVQGTPGACIDPRIAAALKEMQSIMGENSPKVFVTPKGEGLAEAYSAAKNVLGEKQPYEDLLIYTCAPDSHVHFAGFAGDFCVKGCAVDTAAMGLKATVWSAATASVQAAQQVGKLTDEKGPWAGAMEGGRVNELLKETYVNFASSELGLLELNNQAPNSMFTVNSEGDREYKDPASFFNPEHKLQTRSGEIATYTWPNFWAGGRLIRAPDYDKSLAEDQHVKTIISDAIATKDRPYLQKNLEEALKGKHPIEVKDFLARLDKHPKMTEAGRRNIFLATNGLTRKDGKAIQTILENAKLPNYTHPGESPTDPNKGAVLASKDLSQNLRDALNSKNFDKINDFLDVLFADPQMDVIKRDKILLALGNMRLSKSSAETLRMKADELIDLAKNPASAQDFSRKLKALETTGNPQDVANVLSWVCRGLHLKTEGTLMIDPETKVKTLAERLRRYVITQPRFDHAAEVFFKAMLNVLQNPDCLEAKSYFSRTLTSEYKPQVVSLETMEQFKKAGKLELIKSLMGCNDKGEPTDAATRVFDQISATGSNVMPWSQMLVPENEVGVPNKESLQRINLAQYRAQWEGFVAACPALKKYVDMENKEMVFYPGEDAMKYYEKNKTAIRDFVQGKTTDTNAYSAFLLKFNEVELNVPKLRTTGPDDLTALGRHDLSLLGSPVQKTVDTVLVSQVGGVTKIVVAKRNVSTGFTKPAGGSAEESLGLKAKDRLNSKPVSVTPGGMQSLDASGRLKSNALSVALGELKEEAMNAHIIISEKDVKVLEGMISKITDLAEKKQLEVDIRTIINSNQQVTNDKLGKTLEWQGARQGQTVITMRNPHDLETKRIPPEIEEFLSKKYDEGHAKMVAKLPEDVKRAQKEIFEGQWQPALTSEGSNESAQFFNFGDDRTTAKRVTLGTVYTLAISPEAMKGAEQLLEAGSDAVGAGIVSLEDLDDQFKKGDKWSAHDHFIALALIHNLVTGTIKQTDDVRNYLIERGYEIPAYVE